MTTLSAHEQWLVDQAMAQMKAKIAALTDSDLTRIYKQVNGEAEGKAQPLTTARIFKAMRATAEFATTKEHGHELQAG